MRSVTELLRARPYPGRGCLAARAADGTLGFVYFLTGRSEASRRREPAHRDDGDVEVTATGGGDRDALRHYVAVARRGRWTVAGNGEQVVPLAEALRAGVGMQRAMREHTFEPDPPIYTTRIWVARERGSDEDCWVGFVRRSDRGDGGVERVARPVRAVAPGTGVPMTTYDGTVEAVRSTTAPQNVRVEGAALDDVLTETWCALDPGLRVAALVVEPDDDRARPRTTAG